MHSFTNDHTAFTAASENQDPMDPLAVYDRQSIGQEFSSDSRAHLAQSMRIRQSQIRQSQLAMNNWREISALSDSQRLDKASLSASRKYETRLVYSQSMITWFVYIGLTALAGIILAFVIRGLNM